MTGKARALTMQARRLNPVGRHAGVRLLPEKVPSASRSAIQANKSPATAPPLNVRPRRMASPVGSDWLSTTNAPPWQRETQVR